jgi:tetratricopeptide (TPR) repeat protein
MTLANFYLGQNPQDLATAEGLLRAAMKTDPQMVGPSNALAAVLASQKRWSELDQLLADSERAIPDNLGPHYQAARVILVAGDTQQMGRAESYLRRYLAVSPEGGQPSLAGAHWRLGLVLEKQGHKDQALAEIQNAVSLEPGLKAAQQDLKRLHSSGTR